MATLGNTATPSFGWQAYGLNVQNTAWFQFTMPSPGGTITAVHGYFDADLATSGTGYVAVFQGGTGALLSKASVGTVTQGTQSTGGQHWHSATLSPGLYVASGALILLVFWMPQSSGLVFSYFSGGSSGIDTETGTSPSGASGGQTGFSGTIGVYADYTPGGVGYVNTGPPVAPVWTQGQIVINTGPPAAPVWTPGEVDVNTGPPGAPVWTPAS